MLTIGLSLESTTSFVAASQESSSPVEGSEDAVNTIQVDEIRNKVRLHASAKKILEQKGIVVVDEALADEKRGIDCQNKFSEGVEEARTAVHSD